MQTSHDRYAGHALQRGQGAVAYIKDQSVDQACDSRKVVRKKSCVGCAYASSTPDVGY